MIRPQRLRAPAADGALLADPPLDEVARRLAPDADRLRAWDHDFQGRRADRLRDLIRSEVLERARAHHERFGLALPSSSGKGPPDRLVVTGHQPELFHAGVWVKNFAVAGLARQWSGAGLNLVIDNDLPKGPAIRVPGTPEEGYRARPVPYDLAPGEVPFEDMAVRDEGLFATFGDRVGEALEGRVPDPLIGEFWPKALAARSITDRAGLRFAAARHATESAWGVVNWEVPLGQVCQTAGFLWFAAHLLAHLPRFRSVHNEALARYRATYKIRSRHHPVPALGGDGEWLEAPFWAWRVDRPRRRPLLVRQLSKSMELRIAGEDEPFAEVPLAADREACCAVDQLRELPARRIRLRTRALTTTLFGRLLLGDAFVHGIGGAKYDELGDEIVRGFFGIEPPRYLTLSMTLWLGLPDDPASPEALRSVERALRDLRHNPGRYLDGSSPGVADWLEAKRSALSGSVETRAERAARSRSIRSLNEAIQPRTEGLRAGLLERRAEIRAGLRRNAVAQSREYSFVLHDRDRLRSALTSAVPRAFEG